MQLPATQSIAVFGGGYIGLVTAAGFAQLGHEVWVREIDPAKVAALQNGRVPIYEPGLAELLAANAQRLHFTLDVQQALARATVAYVCVDTPPSESGDADLSRVWSVIDSLPSVSQLRALVMKSTVPPGTGARVRERLDRAGLESVAYASNPEFTAEGRAVEDWLHPDRIVIGAEDPRTAELVAQLHHGVEAPREVMDVASAEMVKLAANALLATKISFINEIAQICARTGADVEHVARAVGLDHRLGPHFLRPGIGWGGSCFPKDSSALKQLATAVGHYPALLAAVIEVNTMQHRQPVVWLKERLGQLTGMRVAVLGMTFKAGTDDMRQAPSTVIAARLLSEGAEISCWDPLAVAVRTGPWAEARRCADPLEALADADAAVVVTEWPQLRELAWDRAAEVMRRAVLFDGRNLLEPAAMRKLGFDYGCVGRPEAGSIS